MRQIPGLCLLRADPATPWPTLDDIDPFICNLRFRTVATGPLAEVGHLLHYVQDQIEIVTLPRGWPGIRPVEPAVDDETLQALPDG